MDNLVEILFVLGAIIIGLLNRFVRKPDEDATGPPQTDDGESLQETMRRLLLGEEEEDRPRQPEESAQDRPAMQEQPRQQPPIQAEKPVQAVPRRTVQQQIEQPMRAADGDEDTGPKMRPQDIRLPTIKQMRTMPQTQRTLKGAPAQPRPAARRDAGPQPERPRPEGLVTPMLRDPESLRQAVVLKEILDPPVALRNRFGGDNPL